MNRPAVVQKVPPVLKMAESNASSGLDIYMTVTPARVFNVDESRQTVQVAADFNFYWEDPALVVDSDLAQIFTDGNSSLLPFSVTVPSQVLWLPALIVAEGVSLSLIHI